MFLQLLHLFNYFRVGLPRRLPRGGNPFGPFWLTVCNLLYCYIFAGVVPGSVSGAVQTSDCLPEIAEISFRGPSSQRHNCVKSQKST